MANQDNMLADNPARYFTTIVLRQTGKWPTKATNILYLNCIWIVVDFKGSEPVWMRFESIEQYKACHTDPALKHLVPMKIKIDHRGIKNIDLYLGLPHKRICCKSKGRWHHKAAHNATLAIDALERTS